MSTRALAVVSELDRYVAEIERYPMLGVEEEQSLARRWRDIVAAGLPPDRQAAQEDLKEQFLDAIRTHRDPATRAAKKEVLPDLGAIASGISQALRQARFDEE